MRTRTATFIVASLTSILTVTAAQAAPTQIHIRVEGKHETLFEGPILTEGHNVRATSDTRERSCDGINSLDPENMTPGATPTAASADAMGIIGETFDGRWYPGYNDYLITRWGPDREAEDESWGILVNNVLTDVGGCQFELSASDEVLWAYNAFEHGDPLALYPADDTSGGRPLTATAELGKPFQVEVFGYEDNQEEKPPLTPERVGSSPYDGAEVSPVRTSSNGFQKVETESSVTARTDAEGKTSITFTEPGWHRIKATAVNTKGEENAIRSNRLDVCVPVEGSSSCGEAPAEDRVRTPPATPEPETKPEETGPGHPESGDEDPESKTENTTQQPSTIVVTAPFSADQLSGSGLVSSIKPPPAKGLLLHGRVLKLLDDRASGLRYRGHWRHVALGDAWLGTVSRAGAGGRVSVTQGAGRPVFLLRAMSRAAKVEVLSGTRREVFAVASGPSGSSRLIIAAARSRMGTVRLRVLSGMVDLDGVAEEP